MHVCGEVFDRRTKTQSQVLDEAKDSLLCVLAEGDEIVTGSVDGRPSQIRPSKRPTLRGHCGSAHWKREFSPTIASAFWCPP